VNRSRFNPKRRLHEPRLSKKDREALLTRASYTGNPAHKRDPGDFGLTPPASPRRDKTLCDDAGIFERAAAQSLLESGIRRGLVSSRHGAGDNFPQNIWAVSDEGIAFEAQLENPLQGTYHGYPLPDTDPLEEQVLAWWEAEDA
jgi:hypothetical protein